MDNLINESEELKNVMKNQNFGPSKEEDSTRANYQSSAEFMKEMMIKKGRINANK